MLGGRGVGPDAGENEDVVLGDEAAVLPEKFVRDRRRVHALSLAAGGCPLDDHAGLPDDADETGRRRPSDALGFGSPGMVEGAVAGDGLRPDKWKASWSRLWMKQVALPARDQVADPRAISQLGQRHAFQGRIAGKRPGRTVRGKNDIALRRE